MTKEHLAVVYLLKNFELGELINNEYSLDNLFSKLFVVIDKFDLDKKKALSELGKILHGEIL